MGLGQTLGMPIDPSPERSSGSPASLLDHTSACTLVPRYANDLVSTVGGSRLNLEVPTCPGWDLGKLIRHVGTVYRWAGRIVETQAAERLDARTLDLEFPSGPSSEWSDWLRASAVIVSDALDDSVAGTAMWAWGGDQRADFWGRRMVHETAVHLADVLAARGEIAPGWYPGPAWVAADGVDEFFDNLPFSKGGAVAAALPKAGTIHLHATDAESGTGQHPAEWTVDLYPDGFAWTHEHRKGDIAVRGSTEDLLLFVYGRLGPEADGSPSNRFEVFGDRGLLDEWVVAAKT